MPGLAQPSGDPEDAKSMAGQKHKNQGMGR